MYKEFKDCEREEKKIREDPILHGHSSLLPLFYYERG